MKKIILTTTLLLGAACVFAASDLYVSNVSSCTPYQDNYKSPSGAMYERGVLGTKIGTENHNLYCVYYKQISDNDYQLCQRRTNLLPGDKTFGKKVDCSYVDRFGLEQIKNELSKGDIVLEYVQTEPTVTPVNQEENQ